MSRVVAITRFATVVGATALAAFALTTATARALHAQADEAGENVFTGTVVDDRNGHPLVGAFVHVVGDDRGVFTDDEGRFVYPDFPIGEVELGVEQLGYEDLVQTVQSVDRDDLVLSMAPEPMLLEGIEIVMDRFETRRRAVAVASRVFERDELLDSPALDALEFLEARTLLRTQPCPVGALAHGCVRVRGRVVRADVYVDEAPFLDGLNYLRSMQPHELHRVEVYAGGRHVRVYTEGFVEWAGRARLNPIAFVR